MNTLIPIEQGPLISAEAEMARVKLLLQEAKNVLEKAYYVADNAARITGDYRRQAERVFSLYDQADVLLCTWKDKV